MSYKTILVCLADDEKAESLVQFAATLARKFQAHLIGVHALASIPIYPSAGMAVDIGLYSDLQSQHDARVKKCMEIFAKVTKKEIFPAEWRALNSKTLSVSQDLIANALTADLILVGQAESGQFFGQMEDLRKDLITGSGRPVLMVPNEGKFDDIGKKVLLGWNATRESANAMHAAMPFLQQSDETIIFTVAQPEDDNTKDEFAGHELAENLSRHGVKSRISHQPQEAVTVGSRMLNEAADQGADLIVMGAFGHSRVHAFIFGAATRQMLDEMTVPILFSN